MPFGWTTLPVRLRVETASRNGNCGDDGEYRPSTLATVIADQLAHDEPLSPELVLVLPPELRARAIARLGEPVWPRPRPPLPEVVASDVEEPIVQFVGKRVGARVAQLAFIFLAVTLATLALSAVAQAFRPF
jgi:hypothetical protein